jgi:hypothetical protein
LGEIGGRDDTSTISHRPAHTPLATLICRVVDSCADAGRLQGKLFQIFFDDGHPLLDWVTHDTVERIALVKVGRPLQMGGFRFRCTYIERLGSDFCIVLCVALYEHGYEVMAALLFSADALLFHRRKPYE